MQLLVILYFLLPPDVPGSFISTCRGLLNDSGYADTVREVRWQYIIKYSLLHIQVIKAGGCNCSRSLVTGFCLGAKYGIEGIPREWIDKTFAAEEGLRLAIQLVKMFD